MLVLGRASWFVVRCVINAAAAALLLACYWSVVSIYVSCFASDGLLQNTTQKGTISLENRFCALSSTQQMFGCTLILLETNDMHTVIDVNSSTDGRYLKEEL